MTNRDFFHVSAFPSAISIAAILFYDEFSLFIVSAFLASFVLLTSILANHKMFVEQKRLYYSDLKNLLSFKGGAIIGFIWLSLFYVYATLISLSNTPSSTLETKAIFVSLAVIATIAAQYFSGFIVLSECLPHRMRR